MQLDFPNTDTTYYTHGFHTYPAKMIPQVANALINEYGKKSQILLDPYCGSGTSLVEANAIGLNAVGSDLNPLARLIARVKTQPIELQSLDLHLKDFYDYMFKFRFGFDNNRDSIVCPSFNHINFWFSKNVKTDLTIISKYIELIESMPIKEFFQVGISQTIRECSWTRKNEFKLYKMSPDHIKVFKPDAISTMEKVLGRNRKGLENFMKSKVRRNASSIILDFNSVEQIPNNNIEEESIDLVVTSPPYGDSSTTVAYGQFSALANQWLGFMEKGRALDNQLMGGEKKVIIDSFPSRVLNRQLNEIRLKDEKRARDVYSFYQDYLKSISNVSDAVKRKGYICYVVSNRSVKGITLKTDVITRDFFLEKGLKHIDTFERKISSKRMPRQNSPNGQSGKKQDLMNTEYIVVMQKQ